MTAVTDDFNRADGALGANWTAYVNAGLVIVSNTAHPNVSAGSRGSKYTGASFTDDQYAEAEIGAKGTGNYFSVGVRVNGTDGSRSGYIFSLGGSNELYISKYASGSGTDHVTSTATFANGDIMRIEAVDSGANVDISVLVNGVEVNSWTDTSSVIASGLPSMEIYSGTGTSNFNSFGAGDIGGGGGSIVPTLMMLGIGT